MTATANENEIRITRMYDAPLALVWDAFTNVRHVARWWGPRGFTITTQSKTLEPGGSWEYIMHGPDGTDWPNFTRYHVVEHQRRLVYDHGASSADSKPMFQVIADFRDVNGKTELDMRMVFDSPEATEMSRGIIRTHGGNSTWDRLAEYLEQETSHKEIFVINRSFPLPIDRMYDMWTNPEHFRQWLPPTGFTMDFQRADIRSGGQASYSMTNGEFTMFGAVEYLELRRPDRLSYLQYFTDAAGNMSRHPGSPTWPEKMLTTVTLAPEGDSATRVSVRWEPYGNTTPAELAAFVAEKAGMTKGWTGSFDKLDLMIAASAV